MSAASFGAFETCSNSFKAFFAWQNDCDYRQCRPHKTSFSGRIGCVIDKLREMRISGITPAMTQFEGDLSPPFEIVEPADWRAPIIFNSPHSGSVYPLDFLNASRIDS